MWRALFLALGTYAFILGAECLLIEKAIMTSGQAPQATGLARLTTAAPQPKEVAPPPWAPWTLMSVGTVVVIYSFTLPQKLKG